ncbi:phage head closure protein [Pullulanibacillus sp. KACC 23026]|uniref:phage head closure protein n=1 Tax=Pullulanibacillus sp. KACC 23026 TaxID=3028315 RepID=UPI0023AF2AE2|nr:phage head closure protein [Pullulanibacillus sp. KACC 23026]WEG14002.1 phage head closure protein [Pullulanibacillus sp. KACC 23026]
MTKFIINAGKYRHPITIQKPDEQQLSSGEPSGNWLDVISCRAGIYPISGSEFFNKADTVQGEVTHQILMRYYPGIQRNMRVEFGDRIFQITSVVNFQEMNKELQLMCKELL